MTFNGVVSCEFEICMFKSYMRFDCLSTDFKIVERKKNISHDCVVSHETKRSQINKSDDDRY